MQRVLEILLVFLCFLVFSAQFWHFLFFGADMFFGLSVSNFFMIEQQKICNKITTRFVFLVSNRNFFETKLAYNNNVKIIFILYNGLV